MATDVGRVRAAIGGIHAVTVSGSEKSEALEALYRLEVACKYAKTEVRRPEFLSSIADYSDAPDGTEVSKKFGPGFWKKVDGCWLDENNFATTSWSVACAERRVTKWGDL